MGMCVRTVWLSLLTITRTVVTEGALCSYHDTLADLGIKKMLASPLLEDFPLDDIYEHFGSFYTVWVTLTEGKLSGLANLRRGRRNFFNVTDCGLYTVLQVEGGPLVISYQGYASSALLDSRFRLRIAIGHFRMTIYVKEPAPNKLTLQAFGFDCGALDVDISKQGSSNIFFNIAAWFAERSLKDKVGNALGPVVHKIAHQFLGMLELYAINGTAVGAVKHPREDPEYEPSLIVNIIGDEIHNEGLGPEYFPPVPWSDPTRWGLFGYSIKRIVLTSGLDPVLFTDIEDTIWGLFAYHIANVTVDGLAFLRRGGNNSLSIEEYGIAARVALTFENVRLRVYASTFLFRVRIDVFIYEADIILQLREKNKTLEIEDYQLNFTVPIRMDAYVLTPIIGPLAQRFGRYTNRTFSEEEAQRFKVASRKYVERALLKVQEFITDPASKMPWDHSIIEAYRKSKETFKR